MIFDISRKFFLGIFEVIVFIASNYLCLCICLLSSVLDININRSVS